MEKFSTTVVLFVTLALVGVGGRARAGILGDVLPEDVSEGVVATAAPIVKGVPLGLGSASSHGRPKATIDPNSVTVSGFSSGGFMSAQLHFAYSSIIKGSGQFAGGPYAQHYGFLHTNASSVIGVTNFLLTPLNLASSLAQLVQQAKNFEGAGEIDALSNMKGHKVFIFHGLVDPLVPLREANRSKQMFEAFEADVKIVLLPNATHCVPTDNFGLPCEVLDAVNDAVNNCGYEGVFEMFSHIYPNFTKPSSSTAPQADGSEYYHFDQTPFIPSEYKATNAYMAKNGYIYIPPGCQNPENTCALHIALHGCGQSTYTVLDLLPNLFATKTGYTQVADANNIVVIFPQAAPVHVGAATSSLVCWDFFGGTTPYYAYKRAPQLRSIYNMIASYTKLDP